nr:MAG TPA: hypothetical protein [Inoviridae sp.]
MSSPGTILKNYILHLNMPANCRRISKLATNCRRIGNLATN